MIPLVRFLIPTVIVASCAAPSEEEVQAEFNAFVATHNSCSVDDECVLISPGCPLGCEVAVNEGAAEATRRKAQELIEEYESGGRACQYSCVAGIAVCDEGRCATAAAPDAGGDCTQIGCGPAFSASFSKQSSWQAGDYRVTVDLDGSTVECNATLPLSCNAPFPCDDPDVLLLLEGCALDPSAHALGGIEITTGTPASVSIEVTRDGQTLASDQWSPEYVTSRPNGPGCEPECRTAPGETLLIP